MKATIKPRGPGCRGPGRAQGRRGALRSSQGAARRGRPAQAVVATARAARRPKGPKRPCHAPPRPPRPTSRARATAWRRRHAACGRAKRRGHPRPTYRPRCLFRARRAPHVRRVTKRSRRGSSKAPRRATRRSYDMAFRRRGPTARRTRRRHCGAPDEERGRRRSRTPRAIGKHTAARRETSPASSHFGLVRLGGDRHGAGPAWAGLALPDETKGMQYIPWGQAAFQT